MMTDDLFDPELDGHGDGIDDTCGPPVMRDCVDDCLENLIEHLVQAGYDEAIASQAIYEGLSSLMEGEVISDTPDLDQPETAKFAWIANARPQILQRLRVMGLEFDEE